MVLFLFAYVIALAVFAAVDITWLMTMGAKLYKETLGDILAPDVRLGPAVAFYLIYPIGLVIFGVMPGLKAGSIGTAFVYGALFGFFSYATYELTNFATLRNWTLGITVIDVVYGALASGVVSAIVFAAAPVATRWFGS